MSNPLATIDEYKIPPDDPNAIELSTRPTRVDALKKAPARTASQTSQTSAPPRSPSLLESHTSNSTFRNSNYSSTGAQPSSTGSQSPLQRAPTNLSEATTLNSPTSPAFRAPSSRTGQIRKDVTIQIDYTTSHGNFSPNALAHVHKASPAPSIHDSIHLLPRFNLQGWLQVAAGVCIVANTWGLNLAFGVLEEFYYDFHLLGTGHGRIAWIGSVQMGMVGITAGAVGWIHQRGLGVWVFQASSVVMMAAQAAGGFCGSWWMLLLVQGLVQGLAMGMMFGTGMLGLCAEMGREHWAMATGLCAAGISLGGVIYAVVAKLGLRDPGAFRMTMGVYMLAPMVVIQAAPLWVLRTGTRQRRQQEVDLGIFQDVAFVLLVLGLLFVFVGLHFAYYFIIPYATTVLLLYPDEAINLLLAMLSVNFVAQFVPTLLLKPFLGPLNTILASSIFSTLILTLWFADGSIIAIWVLACLYGLATSGILALFLCVLSETSEHDLIRLGLPCAVGMGAIGTAVAIGPSIGAILIGVTRSAGEYFLWAECWIIGTMVVGCGFLAMSRWWRVRWRWERL